MRSIMKGAVHSNWFPEAPVSEQVSSYMEQLVLLLQVCSCPPPMEFVMHPVLENVDTTMFIILLHRTCCIIVNPVGEPRQWFLFLL